MLRLNRQHWIFEYSQKWKPVLRKVVPISLLRKVKKITIQRSMKELDQNPRVPYEQGKFPDGINFIGSIQAESGLGQSCRLIVHQIDMSGIPCAVTNFDLEGKVSNSNREYADRIENRHPYGVNVIDINPYEMGLAYMKYGRELWDHRYNIAYWSWEMEQFPKEWLECEKLIDEIWTPSEFTSNCFRKRFQVPVYTVPYYMEVPVNENGTRQYFHLPEDQFLFLVMFDSASTTSRKNPMGALRAFEQAFTKDNHKVGLVIKVNNPKEEDLQKIRDTVGEDRNIYLIAEVMEKEKINSLIQCVDVFVSLHRAEGFGLVIAEAMLLGTPVIATNYSANTEFMSEESSCLVDYQLCKIQKDDEIYKKGYVWAEPDVAQAAQYMSRLFEEKTYYQKKKINGKRYVEEMLSKDNTTKMINDRYHRLINGIDK